MFLGTLRCYERVLCSGRRGHFGFFSDGRRAANEFSTTQDSVGAGRVRRLGEVVYQIRRGAFEDETAAAFNHNRRAGRARRRRFGAGRRVHGFDEFEACALELIDNIKSCGAPSWLDTVEFSLVSQLSARFECCRLAALCDASQALRFTVSSYLQPRVRGVRSVRQLLAGCQIIRGANFLQPWDS